MSKPLFEMGRVLATQGALELAVDLLPFLRRHASGDWGKLCDEDKAANDEAIKTGLRIMSCYDAPNGRFWIITEADRSATTALLPREY
ncbi:MAG: hypothetical protein GY803_08090 [Chloroflexi bacterium]|nr:hypothetical protein [Chloroflexota bacterium]